MARQDSADRPLDKRITFEARTTTVEETYGTVSGEDWTEVCSVFASVWELLPGRAEKLGLSFSTSSKLFDIEVRHGTHEPRSHRAHAHTPLLQCGAELRCVELRRSGQLEVHEVGFDTGDIDHDAGQIRDAFREALRVGVILGEALDVMVE